MRGQGLLGVPRVVALAGLLVFCGMVPSSRAFVGPARPPSSRGDALPAHATIAGGAATHATTSTSPAHTAVSTSQKRVEVKFVTSNPLKTREVQALLAEGGLNVPFDIVTLDIELPELQESPLVIAIEKTRLASNRVQVSTPSSPTLPPPTTSLLFLSIPSVAHAQAPCLVEDTSLCFNALGGLPGPYIKHFLDELGSVGLFKVCFFTTCFRRRGPPT
jgi:hypothetical protein